MKRLRSGELRHRITIQTQAEVQAPNGDVSTVWTDFAVNLPASWLAGPGREFLAAEAIRAEVAGRFETRWLDGVTAEMRILFNGAIYSLKAPPMLDPTLRRSMILMVGSGVNDG
jgi:SPP1 family predicted phage head-tail adaptor